MKFAVEVEADKADALDILVRATERWFKSIGATVLERGKIEEECTVAFIVDSKKDIVDSVNDLPGKVTIEPL
jgi:hypothetical protein